MSCNAFTSATIALCCSRCLNLFPLQSRYLCAAYSRTLVCLAFTFYQWPREHLSNEHTGGLFAVNRMIFWPQHSGTSGLSPIETTCVDPGALPIPLLRCLVVFENWPTECRENFSAPPAQCFSGRLDFCQQALDVSLTLNSKSKEAHISTLVNLIS